METVFLFETEHGYVFFKRLNTSLEVIQQGLHLYLQTNHFIFNGFVMSFQQIPLHMNFSNNVFSLWGLMSSSLGHSPSIPSNQGALSPKASITLPLTILL